jgi:endonuclease-3
MRPGIPQIEFKVGLFHRYLPTLAEYLTGDLTLTRQIDVTALISSLEISYGPRPLVPHCDPLGELVQTILSQNTSDANSRPAYQALRQAFPRWEQLLEAPLAAIAEPIKSGGLALIKAQRIQDALLEIRRQRGILDLGFLNDMPVKDGLQWLKKLKGVGDKTANCVLLFALGKPALPVDTHIFRVSKRLGLIPYKASLEEAHQSLIKKVPADRLYPFHMLMIEHGRRICLAQRPRCQSCIIKEICPAANPKTLE